MVRIITDNDRLRSQYDELQAGDIIVGRIRLKKSEEHLLLDLKERGLIIFPSALSQLLSRSKTLQSHIFSHYTLPYTTPVHDRHDLLKVLNEYHKAEIKQVVSKLDRKNAGLGINLWPSIEDLYNQASLDGLPYPFVIQPYTKGCRDIRVVVLGEYGEAYYRENSHNFRQNLHCGGSFRACTLSDRQWQICRKVMRRGDFPYAHIDLMVTEEGKTFFTEINLRGGIRGAVINAPEYQRRLNDIHEAFIKKKRKQPELLSL
ncbi:MAG: ATP-grasp domain-containing protein [Thermodesulfobacteriota bacterium]